MVGILYVINLASSIRSWHKQHQKKNKKNKSNKENKTPKQINNKSTNKIERLYFIFTYFVDITCNVLTLLSLSLFLFLVFFSFVVYRFERFYYRVFCLCVCQRDKLLCFSFLPNKYTCLNLVNVLSCPLTKSVMFDVRSISNLRYLHFYRPGVTVHIPSDLPVLLKTNPTSQSPKFRAGKRFHKSSVPTLVTSSIKLLLVQLDSLTAIVWRFGEVAV